MTNEFKKISKNNETRYVLEDASSTTSASVASMDSPLGAVQRRSADNILAQEADKKKVPATKPRNFVAKNAKMGGAGQHKDKKKAVKQGDVKHKKPLAENVDNLEIALQQARQITKMIKYDDTVTDIVVKIQALAEKFNIDANDIRYAIDDVYEAKQKLESVVYGLDEIFEDALRNAQYAADDETDFNEDWGKGGYDTYSAGNHGRGVAEEDDVQQELGMAGSELYGIAKHAKELLALIKQHGQQQGLEAWQQSKITKAADYLNAVLQSLDYDTHGEEQGVAEAGFPGAPDVEMPPMNPSGDPQRDKLKQEYVDLHREIKSLVDLQYNSKSTEEKMQAKARIKQLNDRADQIKAILEPRQPPNEWQKKTYGYDDNWNRVGKGVTETKKPSPKLTPVNIKKSEPVSEEINTEAYERLQKVFAFKNYES